MRVAVYPSVLYGVDFITESIESVLPHVDRVYVIMMKRPWGNTSGVTYKGEWVPWPAVFDKTVERVSILSSYAPVELIEAQKMTPWNRWGFGFKQVEAKRKSDGQSPATEVVFIDPDCVFSAEQAYSAFADWNAHPEYAWAAPKHVELWRTPAYRAVCPPRDMVKFHRGDLSLLQFPDPPDGRQLRLPKTHRLAAEVHNLGFAVSEKTMYWKHLTALAFSPVVKESMPIESWYEEKWLKWHPETNNSDLGISVRCESSIARAVAYEVANLPEPIRRRYAGREWPTW